MEVSKEFIEAMNGVLNGEEWRRECWYSSDEHKTRIRINNKSGKISMFMKEEGFKYGFGDYEKASPLHLNIDDYTAQDWKKV